MRFALASALAAALLLASATARADGYIGAGVGSDSALHGGLGAHFDTGDEASAGRLLIGQRMGIVALEASLFGTDLHGVSQAAGPHDYSTISLGVDLKVYLPLLLGLEAYGRAGLNKTWLDAPAERQQWSYEGRGHALGGGLQYTIGLPLADIGLWLDYTRQETDLRDGNRAPLDGRVDMLTLGVSLGL